MVSQVPGNKTKSVPSKFLNILKCRLVFNILKLVFSLILYHYQHFSKTFQIYRFCETFKQKFGRLIYLAREFYVYPTIVTFFSIYNIKSKSECCERVLPLKFNLLLRSKKSFYIHSDFQKMAEEIFFF